MSRVGHIQLATLAESCDGRRRGIIEAVHDLRLATGQQLRRLFFSAGSSTTADRRHARRELAWLNENRLLHRLERRIGGRDAGSEGFVYCLGPVGRRTVEFWQGHGLSQSRSTWEPGASFVDHTLAVTELFVRLREAEQIDLVNWQSEPSCWRSYIGPFGGQLHVKPDAFAIVADDRFEHLWFVEIDCGTERIGTLRRKFRAYTDYASSGTEQRQHGLFPHVLWVTPSPHRSKLLTDVGELEGTVCTFVATTFDQAIEVMIGGTP